MSALRGRGPASIAAGPGRSRRSRGPRYARDRAANLATVAEERGSRDSYPPRPPARPGFEFREAPSQRVEARRRPSIVTVAAALGLAAGVLWLAAAAGGVGQAGELRTAIGGIIDRDFPGEAATTRDKALAATFTFLISASALIGVLQLLGSARVLAGRDRARKALVVLAALAAVHTYLLAPVVPSLMRVAALGALGLTVLAAVATFLPAARPWFARRPR